MCSKTLGRNIFWWHLKEVCHYLTFIFRLNVVDNMCHILWDLIFCTTCSQLGIIQTAWKSFISYHKVCRHWQTRGITLLESLKSISLCFNHLCHDKICKLYSLNLVRFQLVLNINYFLIYSMFAIINYKNLETFWKLHCLKILKC